jgi:hypothetical protein
MDITLSKSSLEFAVTARDLPATKTEPLMPSLDEVVPSASLYYAVPVVEPGGFWNGVARGHEEKIDKFVRRERRISKLLKSIPFSEKGDLGVGLRGAYDWMSTNLKTRYLTDAEELERLSRGRTARRDRATSRTVLSDGEGTPYQLDLLFLALARRLGAQANLVLVSDRRVRNWNRDLLAAGQFDESLVAIWPSDESERRLILVDAGSGLPYGEIPWWLAETRGMVVTKKGAREIDIKGTGPRSNVSETLVSLWFDAGTGTARARWSRTGTGQQGFAELRSLRRLSVVDRAAALKKLCGAAEEMGVSYADVPDMDDTEERFRLECEAEFLSAAAHEESSDIWLLFVGAWIPEVPRFESLERAYPIVMPFPKIDLVRIEVASPPGFVPVFPPEPIRIEGKWGKYFLQVTKTDEGFMVERAVTFPHQRIEPDVYLDLKEFFSAVHRADATRLRFVRSSDGSP